MVRKAGRKNMSRGENSLYILKENSSESKEDEWMSKQWVTQIE